MSINKSQRFIFPGFEPLAFTQTILGKLFSTGLKKMQIDSPQDEINSEFIKSDKQT